MGAGDGYWGTRLNEAVVDSGLGVIGGGVENVSLALIGVVRSIL